MNVHHNKNTLSHATFLSRILQRTCRLQQKNIIGIDHSAIRHISMSPPHRPVIKRRERLPAHSHIHKPAHPHKTIRIIKVIERPEDIHPESLLRLDKLVLKHPDQPFTGSRMKRVLPELHHSATLKHNVTPATELTPAACRASPLHQLRRATLPLMHPGRTRKPPYDSEAALRELTAADPKLGKLIARAGPFTMKLAATQSPFEALAEAIIYQQLHGKAAATIHRRLIESFYPRTPDGLISGPAQHFAAQHILDAPNEQLRAAGLSKNKALALRDLAAKTLDGTVPDLKHIRRMSDEAVIEHLTQVRGIGRWTVEMFLIFRIGRPNVLPVSDYGVRKGFALTFGKLKPTDKVTPMDLPKPEVMHRRAKKWQPWSSIASWYMWRACDLARPSE